MVKQRNISFKCDDTSYDLITKILKEIEVMTKNGTSGYIVVHVDGDGPLSVKLIEPKLNHQRQPKVEEVLQQTTNKLDTDKADEIESFCFQILNSTYIS